MGVFAGWFPLFGLQTLIGITLAALVRGHKIVAAAATWVSNPFTYLPIYAFNFQVGRWLLGSRIEADFDGVQTWDEFMALSSDFAIALFVGCFAVGLVMAAIAYGLGWQVASRIQHQHHQRQLRRHAGSEGQNRG